MSNLSIVNADLDLSTLNSLALQGRYSNQASYSNVASPYTVQDSDKFVFCSDVTTTLNLPTPSLSNVGRDLIVSVRTAHAVNSATQVIVDIEADPNGVSPSPQFSVLPAIAGAWTHLVSNGTYWVSVAKSNF